MAERVQISVILPVYNAEAYLPLLLPSLLNQSERALEVIAVDDGSTDNSLAVLHKMAQEDARLIVLSQSNSGCSAARNSGVELARGRWIAFADTDDWLMSPALETWRRRADSAELDLLIDNAFHFAEHLNESNAPRANGPTALGYN